MQNRSRHIFIPPHAKHIRAYSYFSACKTYPGIFLFLRMQNISGHILIPPVCRTYPGIFLFPSPAYKIYPAYFYPPPPHTKHIRSIFLFPSPAYKTYPEHILIPLPPHADGAGARFRLSTCLRRMYGQDGCNPS